jgi:chromate transporter
MKRDKSSWNLLLPIFWVFFRISPISFGGGYAIIPVLEQEVIKKRQWMKPEDIADVLVVSQTIPGAVAINAATFIGYRIAGVKGAVAAAVGMSLPAVLIAIGLASALLAFRDEPKVAAAMDGMKPAAAALIFYAGLRVFKPMKKNWLMLGLLAVALIVLMANIVSPIMMISGGALIGFLLGLLDPKAKKPEEKEKHPDPDYFLGEGI